MGRGTPEQQEIFYVNKLADLVAASELDRVVLLALDRVYRKDGSIDVKRTRFHVPNRFVFDHCRRHPDRFLLGASVHPYRNDALESLERQKERGAVLIKLLPNSQGFNPADPDLVPYYRMLAELRLPLLVHCGYEHAIAPIDQFLGNPALLRRALDEGTIVIVAHAGAAGRFHRKETFGSFLKLLVEYPNCYGDTSALANIWRTRYLKELLRPETLETRYGVRIEHPFDRFIHGSDFPSPVTPIAFGIDIARKVRSSPGSRHNVLQLDIAIKRAVGVPEACLTRGAELLGVKG